MEHEWRSLDDDREVSESYAARFPDAVYDAADPDWWDILYLPPEEIPYDTDDIADDVADDFGGEAVDEPPIDVEDYDWDDSELYDDDGYYEVELGISYPDNV